MLSRICVFSLLTLALVFAAKKNTGTGRGENQDILLDATVYSDAAAVKELIGDDLGGHVTVVQVKVSPKFTKEVTIDRDDFILRTDKDGDRSKPMAPSQIAGRGALVVTGTRGPSGEGAERSRGWSIGGPIGMGGGGIGGGGSADTSGVKATVEEGGEADSPLKKLLDEKVLPEKKITEPVTGLLYFPMENQKLKDLELLYGPKEDRIRVRFK